MRYLYSSLVLLAVLMVSTAALADAPYSEREGYSRIRYEDSYSRRLKRDYEQFLREQSRQRRMERIRAEDRAAARAYKRRMGRLLEAEELGMRRGRLTSEERAWERRMRAAGRRLEERRVRRSVAVVEERYPPRRYEEPERIRVTGEGANCRPSIVGFGYQKYGKTRAMADALEQWGDRVTVAYGKSFVNPHRARNARYVCDPACSTCVQWICRYRATPCRGEF